MSIAAADSDFARDLDPDVRRTGCYEAARRGDLASLPALAALLADPERGVQAAAFDALTTLRGERSVAAVLPVLRNKDERVRNLARELLTPLVAAWTSLYLPYLQDPDPEVRIFVTEMIGSSGRPDTIPELARLLPDAGPNLKIAVATALRGLAAPEGIDLLVPLAADPEMWVRFAAIEALGAIDGDRALEVLARIAREDDVVVSSGAIDALLRTGRWQAVGYVLEALGRFAVDDAVIARATLECLDLLDNAPAFEIPPASLKAVRPVLLSLMREGPVWTRMRVVQLAGRFRDERTFDAILRLARAEEGPVRLAAIEALGRFSNAEGRDLLRELTFDADPDVATAATAALSSSG